MAVEWTKPDDVPLRSRPGVKTLLNEHQWSYLVTFLRGRKQGVPVDTWQSDWLKMIDFHDRAEAVAGLLDSLDVAQSISDKGLSPAAVEWGPVG